MPTASNDTRTSEDFVRDALMIVNCKDLHWNTKRSLIHKLLHVDYADYVEGGGTGKRYWSEKLVQRSNDQMIWPPEGVKLHREHVVPFKMLIDQILPYEESGSEKQHGEVTEACFRENVFDNLILCWVDKCEQGKLNRNGLRDALPDTGTVWNPARRLSRYTKAGVEVTDKAPEFLNQNGRSKKKKKKKA